jgi:hypothetical protein
MAQSYENQYQLLLKGAAIEEARKKFILQLGLLNHPQLFATPTRG